MASALEQYVNNVRQFSSQGNWSQLCEFILKSMDQLIKNVSHLDNTLATFDMQQHSLGVLGIICAKYSAGNVADVETLYVQTIEFINTCNGEQVRMASDLYSDLCHKYTQSLIEKKQAIRGIGTLVAAIKKVQISPCQLTSVHADLCQLCLLAKCMKPALEFLDTDITDISKEGGHYDAKHFLLYYYYGGMIYTALKKFDRALYFYEAAITTPSLAVSHIMLEAYKKFLLVSLILHGKIPSLPKYTSQVVTRYIKPLCQHYHELATAYQSNRASDVHNLMDKHSETFNRDKTMGLVKQCWTSLHKKNIQRLTKTFLTLSLTDMANRVEVNGPKEAEKFVLHMIEDGEIFATINQKDGMVSFHDNPEKYNDVEMLQQLDLHMKHCIELDTKLQEMDREITVNPQFVQKSSGVHDDDLPTASSSTKAGTYSM